ncbi:MAG: hypothetical protein ACKODK_04975 [Opitutaceae bacterium]
MKVALVLLPCAALLTGCVNFMRTPPDLAQIKREHANSSKVLVRGFELIRYKDRTLLVGKVGRLFFEADTRKTHLDVTLFAADGSVLRSFTTEFSPRQIYAGRRMPGSSSYQVVLDPLPPGLARVEVRAHDGEHTSQ